MGKIYVLGFYLPPSVLIAALYLSVMIIVALCIILRNNRLKHEDLENKFTVERAGRMFFEETEINNGGWPGFDTLDKLSPEFLHRHLSRLKDFYGWRFVRDIQHFYFFEVETTLGKAKSLIKNPKASELVQGAIKGSFLTLSPDDFAHLMIEAVRSEFWLNLNLGTLASKIFTSGVENEKAKANIQWFIEIAEELLSDKLPLANRRWWNDAERLAPEIQKALQEKRIAFLADPKNTTVELKSHMHNRIMKFEKEISKKPKNSKT